MIDLISSLFNIGDQISIEYGNPINVVNGTIIKILPSSIALKHDKEIIGIKGCEIISFNSMDSLCPQEEQDIVAPQDAISDSTAEVKATTTENNVSNDEEHKDVTVEEKTPVTPQFKVGDVIPIDVLQRIDPKINKKNRFGLQNNVAPKEVDEKELSQPQTLQNEETERAKLTEPKPKSKPKTIGKSLEALSSLAQDLRENDNLKMVSAIGTIKHTRDDRRFGFIEDPKTKHTIFFSYNDIIDELTPSVSLGVLYTEIENDQGYKAVSIHRPGTINDLLALAEKQANKRKFDVALNIAEQILLQYPENLDADQVKKKYITKLYRPKKKVFVYKSDGSLYSKAKEFEQKKQFEEAIRLYKQAIDEKDKLESAIKDLAMLYVALYKSDYKANSLYWKKEAIELVDRCESLLTKNITTWNFLLHNFYFPLGNYEKSIDIIKNLLDESSIKSDKVRYSNLLYTKAYNLLRLKRIEDAKDAITEALYYNPQNITAIQLKEQIENIDITDTAQLEQIVSATEFNIVSGGLSLFIIQTLENYDEYAGVKTKDLESRNFTSATLKDVREVIARAGSSRAKDRASYLLTEGKLMQELEPTEEIKLRKVMARYCNAMALSHISENSPIDVIRFYYNESFALEENWDSNVNHVALYLLTHVKNYTELINASRNNLTIEHTLSLLMPVMNDFKAWDNILTMCLNNGSIFAQLFTRIYNNENWREIAIKTLSHHGITQSYRQITRNEFIEIWNSIREKRLNQQKRLTANVMSLGNCSNIEELTSQLYNIHQYREEWIPALDLNRINTIVHFILPALDSFVKSSGYRNKESNYNSSNGLIQQFMNDIKNEPTKLSYEALLPLMNKIRLSLKDAFDELIRMSEPKITLKLLSTETVINEDGTVSLQISVANHKDSSPIKEVSMEVVEDADVKFVKPSETQLHYNAIDGGESSIFKLNVSLSNEIIKNKATAINLLCKYKSGENSRKMETQVSLKLYSPEDYKLIDNPYVPIADGGPVPLNSSMFFGREEFIANIVEAITKSPSKQVIIYGQKRCGKSSVMLRLKDQLESTGKNFCVFFSLGDIIQNLTEASFYHKILSSIKDELEDLEFNGKIIPDIQFPNVQEFKSEDIENPLNTFTKYMRQFKRACKLKGGWEDRNLVVMIDEFTYLYTEIKMGHISPSIMKQWKAVTQNDKAQFSVVLVGQDVVPSFKKEAYARHAFGVLQDIRLTYLQEEPARALIEKPILDENGESRYIGNAVSRIMEYTSRNPYYIQIFCARLVDFMNHNKCIKVTEADVNDVANSFVSGEQALEEDKFDNLIRAGEKEDLQEYPEAEIFAILRQIAVSSKNIGYCCIDDITILGDKKREKEIIKHLIDREVLEQKGENNYRIQVKLFQEWLLNH